MSADSSTFILNVDDNDAARYVKTRILTRAGFEVVEAASGEATLRMLAERKPALVLLDVRLPDMNGRDVCAHIKADAGLAGVVVLQTSATHIDSAHRVASLDAGADGYLVEPIEPEELVANVRALLRMRRAEDEREAALEALREADRRKDEVLAMLGHELRNPLGPIRNAVEILRLAGDEQTRERTRQLIGRQVQHLSRLVDDLLEVSRITQRKVVLQASATSLASIVDSALDVARPAIESRGQTLEVSMPASDTWIDVDPVRMSQVIGNLLHNAGKFTPSGGRISLRVEAGPSGVRIEVADNGMGMSAEILPRVFDLFLQGEASLDRSQGGLGIGLSLVKGLVEMHGGSIEAESEGPGKGSRFVIRLPAERVVNAPCGLPEVESARGRARRRILVVEDNPDAAEGMRMMLAELGHEVAIVGDGREAVELARRFAPEVILLDIGLPGMDGYELARNLRRMPETRASRMIAVTGYGQQKDRARSAEAGFDLHLVKPVDPAWLADLVAGAAS
jgi:signal transduction histidine kinase